MGGQGYLSGQKMCDSYLLSWPGMTGGEKGQSESVCSAPEKQWRESAVYCLWTRVLFRRRDRTDDIVIHVEENALILVHKVNLALALSGP